ncbi:hypothetical protein AB0D40_21705 [Streptomyces massasporeus]|uniref:hypothetical protein n=1 Tax=Streptomyces massasporeus TaxID=67324 RepID=UPI0033E89E2F
MIQPTAARIVAAVAAVAASAGKNVSMAIALMDFRSQFVAHMGTAALRLRERPQIHHQRARLRWQILAEDGDGAPFATGTDVILLDEDGRITSVPPSSTGPLRASAPGRTTGAAPGHVPL